MVDLVESIRRAKTHDRICKLISQFIRANKQKSNKDIIHEQSRQFNLALEYLAKGHEPDSSEVCLEVGRMDGGN